MKAFLLAAGYGTRLSPLTSYIPKCLIPLNGRPLIEYWFDIFEKFRITDILINTNYLAEEVAGYIGKNNREGLNVSIVYEEDLLGSAGTIIHNKKFVESDSYFAVFYADNLTNIDLSKMLNFHLQKDTDITIAAVEVDNPSDCGILTIDSGNRIIDFVEKPEHPKSKLGNAGIYIINNTFFNIIDYKDKEAVDFGLDILPDKRIRKHAYLMNEYLLDIGTWPNYIKANWDILNNNFDAL